MNRREFLARSTLLLGTGFVFGSERTIAEAAGGLAPSEMPTRTLVNSGTDAPCLWGVHAATQSKQTQQQAILALEQKVGRTFAIDRHYYSFYVDLPTPYEVWTTEDGRIPYVSWQARRDRKSPISWSRIASGSHDHHIRRNARRLRSWGRPIYLVFHHEPDGSPINGTSRAYKRAYRRIRSIFNDVGVPNVTWVITLMASTFHQGHEGRWLPKDTAKYDLVGVDGYNRFPCSKQLPWRSFETIFAPARKAAIQRNKKLFVGEWASVEQNACGYAAGSPTAKAEWITGALATVKAWPEVAAVVYTNESAQYDGRRMLFWADTSSPSLSAFTTAGLDPYVY